MEKKKGGFRTSIGGQALIEGILMRGPEKDAIVVRSPEGLVTKVTERKFVKDKYPILGIPILRGAVTFISSMITGVKALMFSADYFPDDENAEPGKLDKWLDEHIPADKLQSLIVAFSVVLSIGLMLVLFMLLPTFIAGLFHATSPAVHNLIEGVVKIAGMIPGPETKEIVSYLPDADWLPDWMRVEELVNMFQDFYGTPCEAKAYIGFDAAKANEMLARLNIDPKARLKTLSKGTKEKVQLVLAMSRAAKLYLLDEPIGGVDPAARDYILNTIISNYSKDATVVISTHLIEDIEPVLDEAVFLKDGKIFAHRAVDDIRETEGKSVDAYFREVFKC